MNQTNLLEIISELKATVGKLEDMARVKTTLDYEEVMKYYNYNNDNLIFEHFD